LFFVAFVALSCCAAGTVHAAAAAKHPPAGDEDPGVTDVNVATTICASSGSASKPSATARAKTFARYKVAPSRRGRYVVDLLVPASLGGTTSPRNLWPQLRTAARTKNVTEQQLHTLVCSGQLDIATAQRVLVTDWRTAGTQAQAAVDTRKASVGAFLAAQMEAERQAALAAYVASLPPPTTAPPPETTPPAVSRPRPTCEQLIQAQLICGVEGEVRCADSGTPYVCSFDHENVNGGRVLMWRRA
jgi:hypothetical protein